MVLNYIKETLIVIIITFSLFSCDNKKNEFESNKETQNSITENKVSQKVQNSQTKDIKIWNPSYAVYSNSRYGFSVRYPSNLTGGAESENGDGKEFTSSDGFNLIVYGSNDVSVLNYSLDVLYNEELKSHKDVTYKVKKKNWFVVSGYDGEQIFYVKKYVGAGSSNTLSLKYPSNLRDKYYDVITVISKSFIEGNINSAN